MKAAEWFIKGLQERGVEWMATLCGHGLDPLYHAAKRAGMRLIDTRNEQTAGYMAECYGRLTRRPGVCAVSSGVAHVNAMTGVLNAYLDGAPMLLISGAGAVRTAGMGHFQDFDQVALARPVTKYARLIDCAERTVQILDEALQAAVAPRPGPVHLTFPLDVQTTEVDETRLVRPTPRLKASAFAVKDPEQVALSLAKSRQPLIVAGSGIHYSGTAQDLVEFSERYLIPMVVPIWDRGCVDRPTGTFFGVLGAASGGPRLLPDADCILMAGAAVDYRVGFLQPGAIGEDAAVLDGNVGWRELQSAYERHGGTCHTSWFEEARRRRDEFRRSVERTGASQAKQGTHAIHIVAALRKVITEETVVLIDGGSIGQWAHQLLCDRYPGHWLTCGRSGVVGWGIGGAMAARLAYPSRPVILLAGDGAFTFNVADLECAVRQSLPFVAVVADDQGWGITRTGHLKQFGESISSSLGPIAIDGLAEALGARGVRVKRPEEIEGALERALSEPAVTVTHIPIVGGNPGG
jgi:acetolactate synthase-1/2/3 large subunit